MRRLLLSSPSKLTKPPVVFYSSSVWPLSRGDINTVRKQSSSSPLVFRKAAPCEGRGYLDCFEEWENETCHFSKRLPHSASIFPRLLKLLVLSPGKFDYFTKNFRQDPFLNLHSSQKLQNEVKSDTLSISDAILSCSSEDSSSTFTDSVSVSENIDNNQSISRFSFSPLDVKTVKFHNSNTKSPVVSRSFLPRFVFSTSDLPRKNLAQSSFDDSIMDENSKSIPTPPRKFVFNPSLCSKIYPSKPKSSKSKSKS
eukprot:Sdes_comp22618_c0_seq1m21045